MKPVKAPTSIGGPSAKAQTSNAKQTSKEVILLSDKSKLNLSSKCQPLVSGSSPTASTASTEHDVSSVSDKEYIPKNKSNSGRNQPSKLALKTAKQKSSSYALGPEDIDSATQSEGDNSGEHIIHNASNARSSSKRIIPRGNSKQAEVAVENDSSSNSDAGESDGQFQLLLKQVCV